jgi:hypothetical protein
MFVESRRIVVAVALLSLAFVTGAHAQPGQAKAKAKGPAPGKERAILFVPSDRAAVRAYWTETFGQDCPPGLAKKSKACLPPGHARKRYAIGTPLPTTVVIDPLPAALVKQLRPAPENHRYVVVDGDVLLLVTATRQVVDAIANALD